MGRGKELHSDGVFRSDVTVLLMMFLEIPFDILFHVM